MKDYIRVFQENIETRLLRYITHISPLTRVFQENIETIQLLLLPKTSRSVFQENIETKMKQEIGAGATRQQCISREY